MHGESHVLRSDPGTLMYVLCHNASAKHFDLTIGLAFLHWAGGGEGGVQFV